jgi:hypothetical protein
VKLNNDHKGGVVKKRTALLILASLFCIVLLASCAPGPNVTRNVPDQSGDLAGFWLGLWHGMIAVITFIISLFNDHVTVYEVHNNGGWYNFGFLIGIGAIFGGGGSSTRR